jgi:hypothetical protein
MHVKIVGRSNILIGLGKKGIRGWLILNWDAALDASQKKMGGVVLRDSSGTVLAALG